ncbi:MAG: hypothetical protein ABIZ80_15205, partial [Bryobacteraceae bacterium]
MSHYPLWMQLLPGISMVLVALKNRYFLPIIALIPLIQVQIWYIGHPGDLKSTRPSPGNLNEEGPARGWANPE